MGNLLCCDLERKTKDTPKSVHLLDLDNTVVKQFDNVSIASTPRSRNIAFHNHVPEDNECLLMPSSLLPNRLRTINANRICSEITVLFCRSEEYVNDIYNVQEQHKLDRNHPTATPQSQGDLIVQCGPVIESIAQVKIIY